jgi:hypothetical protein
MVVPEKTKPARRCGERVCARFSGTCHAPRKLTIKSAQGEPYADRAALSISDPLVKPGPLPL